MRVKSAICRERYHEETACRHLAGGSDGDAGRGPRRGYHPLRAPEGRSTHAGAEGMGRHDRRPAAQREVHRPALPRLYPQPRPGAAAIGAVGISALDYLAAAAPERTGDPDHRPAVDRTIRV